MDIIKYSIIITALINFFSFILTGVDKYKSKHNRWRVKENTFFILALIGGSMGILMGMYLFRHKTKHIKFTLGIPLILIVQISLIVFLSIKYINK